MDSQPAKRPKVDKPKLPPPQRRCLFLIEHRKKNCLMFVKKNAKFCPEHMVLMDPAEAEKLGPPRVPCPLDPTHSIWEKDLKRHVKKCNARPGQEQDPWYEENYNLELADEEAAETTNLAADAAPSKFSVETVPPQYEAQLRLFRVSVSDLPRIILEHPGLERWLSIKEKKKTQKHVIQQSSLVGHLQAMGLLDKSVFYMEFGCGKGEFLRMVNLCLIYEEKKEKKSAPEKTLLLVENQNGAPDEPLYQVPQPKSSTLGFGFVDRGTNRQKVDNRILNDCMEAKVARPTIRRSRIDIAHLNLDRFVDGLHVSRLVGILKHLCGAATDLTLRLIVKSNVPLDGMVMAMCCRHACNYKQLLPESKNYLKTFGFDESNFEALKRIATWAVSGGPEKGQKLGHIARRLIDESRVFALKQRIGEDFSVSMCEYADPDVTSENVILRVLREGNI